MMKSERREPSAPGLFTIARQLLRAAEYAVRGWSRKRTGKLSSGAAAVQGLRQNKPGTVRKFRRRLHKQLGAMRHMKPDVFAGVNRWASGALDRVRRDARRARRLIEELPSMAGQLSAAIVRFYTGNRTGNRAGKADTVKKWLSGQLVVGCALLVVFANQIRLWGLDSWNWMRQDTRRLYRACAGEARRRLSALQSMPGDWRAGRLRVDWRSLAVNPIPVSLLACLILVGGNQALTENRLIYAAVYDGREIGMVASRQSGEEIRLQVQHDLESQVGKQVFLPASLTYRTYVASRAALSPANELTQSFRSLPWTTEGELIYVNSRPLLAVADQSEALLEQLKAYYVQKYPGETIFEVQFQDSIAIERQQVPVSQVVPATEALALLKQGQAQQDNYVAKQGESLWSIALSHGLLLKDLVEANPQLAQGLLSSGDELNLSTVQPLIGVQVVSNKVVREAIPREVKVQPDGNLWSGQTKVLQDGADGEAEVSYQVVRLNDRQVQQDVLTRTVLKEPQARLVAEGTRRTVALASSASRGSGSGVLAWPVSGTITSRYGTRGSSFHGALDIATAYGTPVGAAAAGRVIFAGWDGSYGRSVIVDHGDGLVTRYAHLSQIGVSFGAQVGRGGVVGNIGQSGNATGPHLHLEVLANGSAQNPLNFLR